MMRAFIPRHGRGSLIWLLAASLAAAASGSCLLMDMSSLSVTSWSPRDTQLSTVSDTVIQVEFSRPVNALLTGQAFSVTADDSPLAGRVAWTDDSTLTFTPDEPLEDFVVYQMRVSRQAEDTEGRDLFPEFEHTFTTKTDYVRPMVISSSPADHQSVTDPLTPITVSFSEPMDSGSLYATFALSPSTGGFFSMSVDGAILTFTPTQWLQWQTRYTITITRGAADRQRNTLGSDSTSHFFVGTDLIAPAISAVRSVDASLTLIADDPADTVITVTPGWESTQGLVVTFSEPVLTTGAASAIQISPTVQSTIEEANNEYTSTLTYSFPDRLACGVTYTVSVMPGIQDAQGNRTTGQTAYHFLVNGPATAPPVVTRVAFPVGPAVPANNVLLADYDPISLPLVTAGEVDAFFDLYIDLAQGATLDRFVVGQAFSVETTNNAAAISSFAVEVGPAVTNPAPSAAANEVVARVWVHITNNAASGQVVIHLSTDLKDSGGAALAREFLLPLNDPN